MGSTQEGRALLDDHCRLVPLLLRDRAATESETHEWGGGFGETGEAGRVGSRVEVWWVMFSVGVVRCFWFSLFESLLPFFSRRARGVRTKGRQGGGPPPSQKVVGVGAKGTEPEDMGQEPYRVYNYLPPSKGCPAPWAGSSSHSGQRHIRELQGSTYQVRPRCDLRLPDTARMRTTAGVRPSKRWKGPSRGASAGRPSRAGPVVRSNRIIKRISCSDAEVGQNPMTIDSPFWGTPGDGS